MDIQTAGVHLEQPEYMGLTNELLTNTLHNIERTCFVECLGQLGLL